MEGFEAGECVWSEAGEGGADAVEGFAAHVARLAVEFVGVAHELLEVALRAQRAVLGEWHVP